MVITWHFFVLNYPQYSYFRFLRSLYIKHMFCTTAIQCAFSHVKMYGVKLGSIYPHFEDQKKCLYTILNLHRCKYGCCCYCCLTYDERRQ